MEGTSFQMRIQKWK